MWNLNQMKMMSEWVSKFWTAEISSSWNLGSAISAEQPRAARVMWMEWWQIRIQFHSTKSSWNVRRDSCDLKSQSVWDLLCLSDQMQTTRIQAWSLNCSLIHLQYEAVGRLRIFQNTLSPLKLQISHKTFSGMG